MSNSIEIMPMYLESHPTWWNKPLWGYEPETQPWWNRPLWGKGNIIQTLLKEFNREIISENVISQHNRILEDLSNLTNKLNSLDNVLFQNPEFIFYLKVQEELNNRSSEYYQLGNVIKLLRVGIEVKHLLINLEQLELRYRTIKQQNFYQFVTFLLEKNLTKEQFLNAVNDKAEEISSMMITVCSQTALKSYIKILECLSNYESGFKFLFLLKKYKVTNYSILNSLAEVINHLLEREMSDFKSLLTVVTVNSKLLSKLTEITGLPDELATGDNYARILQFLTLSAKYEDIYGQFNYFQQVLRLWSNSYDNLLNIREQYNTKIYKQCADFQEEIPGVEIFAKYKAIINSLS